LGEVAEGRRGFSMLENESAWMEVETSEVLQTPEVCAQVNRFPKSQ